MLNPSPHVSETGGSVGFVPSFCAAVVSTFLFVTTGAGNLRAQEPVEPPQPLTERQKFRERLFDRTAESVVFIVREDSMGSGFFVSNDGLALTNRHVVGDRDEVEVVLHSGEKRTAKVVERAEDDLDLALIRVPVESSEPLTLGGVENLQVGSWVASVGHGMGGVWTFTKGMVSNIYPSGKDRPVFQTQIPLNPGASGAPIIDAAGYVVGIVTSGLVDSNSINFAIRSDVAVRTFDRLHESCRCVVLEAPEGVPIFVDGETVGQGPKVVVSVGREQTLEVFAVIDGEMHETEISYPETSRLDLSEVATGRDE